jgi:hypothetical protein
MKTAFKLALASCYVQSDKFTAGIKRGINAGAEFLDITMPSRGFDGGADNNLQDDVQQVNRLIVKNCVRDHACDVVIDLAADPRMQRISNLRYYAAGSHFTAEGYKIWADYVVKGLKETSHLPLK